ncbi:MAG TPA: sodium:solute symporter family protein [Armatimonadetes bacterium]|nr:sodium:solute symporter family protein [Armatimonadota bacterium]
MRDLLLIVVLLGGYALAVLFIGVLANRATKEATEEEYFVAGRTFGLFVLFFTYEATLFSMWFFLGSGGFWYTHGVGFYCHVLWMMMSALLLSWIGVRVWLLGKRYNFVTPADLLAYRYGSEAVRVVAALVGIGFVFPYILLQIKGGGLMLEAASGIPFWQGAGLMLLVVVIYTALGGGRAVGWTDAFQGMLFLSAIWGIAIGIVIRAAGGVEAMFDRLLTASPQHLTLPGPAGKFTYSWWFTFWFMQGIALTNPGVWMRIYSARNPTMLRRTAALVPLAGVVGYLATMFYAFAGIPHFPGLVGREADQLLPLLLTKFMPTLTLPMIVGAFAAGMSTADSQLLAISAIATSDLYKRYLRPAASQQHLVWVGRTFMVVFTLAAYLVSLTKSPTLLVSLGVMSYAGVANLIVPLIGALFWRRATAPAAVAGPLVGVIVFLLLDPKTNLWLETELWSLYPGFVGLAANVLVFVLVSLHTKPGPQEKAKEFTNFFAEMYGGK